MYHSLFIQSPTERPLGCFQILAIMNKAAINNYVHVKFPKRRAGLLMCLVILVFLQSAEQSKKFKGFMLVSLLVVLPFWSMLTNIRFSGIAMYMTAIFYLLREKPKARDITAAVVGTVLKVTGGVSVLLTRGYNQERGSYPKYLFYALYPTMWIVLTLVKLFV